jgi:hypothetical protein
MAVGAFGFFACTLVVLFVFGFAACVLAMLTGASLGIFVVGAEENSR